MQIIEKAEANLSELLSKVNYSINENKKYLGDVEESIQCKFKVTFQQEPQNGVEEQLA